MKSQLNSAASGAKALVVFPGALGDFVCFLPALDEIARGRNVDLLARTEYGGLVPQHIHAMSSERRELARLFAAATDLEDVRDFFRSYETIYSWSGGGDAVFRANFARAAGPKGRLFPFRPPASGAHITDYYLECVGARAGAHPAVAPRPEALEWARGWLGAHGLSVNGNNPILLVAPGSGAKEKNWPRQFFREAIAWWEGAASGKVTVVLGPAEDDEASFWTEIAPVARGLSLARLAALSSLSHIYLGNDSGVTHLAAAAGAKTVALFGPTDAAQWAPRGPAVTVVRLGAECSPCERSTMKICPHRRCLNTLHPHEILRVLDALIRPNQADFPILDKGVGRH